MLTATVETIARVTGGQVLHGPSRTSSVDGRRRLATRSRRAASSWRCRASTSTATRSCAPRCDGGARVHTGHARRRRARDGARCRRPRAMWRVVQVGDARAARCRRSRATTGRGSTARSSASPAPPARPPPRTSLLGALDRACDVVATEGNRNNELGVPLTRAAAGARHRRARRRDGHARAGQIARAVRDRAADGRARDQRRHARHIELLGTQEARRGTPRASSSSVSLPRVARSSTAMTNGPRASRSRPAAPRHARTGRWDGADVRATDIDDRRARPRRSTCHDAGRRGAGGARRSLAGTTCTTRLAAAAVGLYLGSTLSQVAEGLARAAVSPMRMEVFETADGLTVVNDAYNANPSSMRPLRRRSRDMQGTGQRVAVLGDMAELGSLTELAHFQHRRAGGARRRSTRLVTVGDAGAPDRRRAQCRGHAGGAGHDRARRLMRPSRSSTTLLERGDAVLVKASRVMGLEAVVEGLTRPDGHDAVRTARPVPDLPGLPGRRLVADGLGGCSSRSGSGCCRVRNIGQQVRADGPQGHLVKQGTPTMGGVLILFVVVTSCSCSWRGRTRSASSRSVRSCLRGRPRLRRRLVEGRARALARPAAAGETDLARLLAVVFGLLAVNWAGLSTWVQHPARGRAAELRRADDDHHRRRARRSCRSRGSTWRSSSS